MTSSVNVIVTSRARGSRNSREKRRRLAFSEWPRSLSASPIRVRAFFDAESASESIEGSVGNQRH